MAPMRPNPPVTSKSVRALPANLQQGAHQVPMNRPPPAWSPIAGFLAQGTEE